MSEVPMSYERRTHGGRGLERRLSAACRDGEDGVGGVHFYWTPWNRSPPPPSLGQDHFTILSNWGCVRGSASRARIEGRTAPPATNRPVWGDRVPQRKMCTTRFGHTDVAIGHKVDARSGRSSVGPLSNEYSTYQTVKVRFWP